MLLAFFGITDLMEIKQKNIDTSLSTGYKLQFLVLILHMVGGKV